MVAPVRVPCERLSFILEVLLAPSGTTTRLRCSYAKEKVLTATTLCLGAASHPRSTPSYHRGLTRYRVDLYDAFAAHQDVLGGVGLSQ